MTKRVKKNPKDKFERELWELWDAMKRALDKQEAMRGQDGFWEWIAEAARYWNFLSAWESLVCCQRPTRVPKAYADWVKARGLESWTPSLAGPLWWDSSPRFVQRDNAGWNEWLQKQQEKTKAVNERLRKWLDKGITKHRKAKEKGKPWGS